MHYWLEQFADLVRLGSARPRDTTMPKYSNSIAPLSLQKVDRDVTGSFLDASHDGRRRGAAVAETLDEKRDAVGGDGDQETAGSLGLEGELEAQGIAAGLGPQAALEEFAIGLAGAGVITRNGQGLGSLDHG